MTSQIIQVQLATPEIPATDMLGEDSWILSGASTYHDLRSFFFLAPDTVRDQSLGVHFENVKPDSTGSFVVELGVPLMDLFPNLDGKPEYRLAIHDDKGESQEVIFSNLMTRLRFDRDGEPYHGLVSRRALPQVRAGKIAFIPPNASVELFRTFAVTRYRICGSNAEEALDEHLETRVHDFIARLNRILSILPLVEVTEGRVFSLAYSRSSFDFLYFILRGSDDSDIGHGRISPHVGKASLHPTNLDQNRSGALRSLLDGSTSPNDVDELLTAANVFLDAGINEYVLLLIVIVAEIATQRFVHARLVAAGVSHTKLEDMGKDLTYSMMLNVVLFAVVPHDRKPDPTMIGRLNRARKLRNDYMHDGVRPRKDDLRELYTSTRQYVDYLRGLEPLTTAVAGNAQ